MNGINHISDIKINVEYCNKINSGSCGSEKQFLEMADLITKNVPIAKISGTVGRQASFEVRVNDELVYSKLQTMALPDFNAVSDMIKEVSEGKPIRRIKKEQPSECDVM